AQRISPGTTNRCLSITLIHECIVLTLLDSLVPGKNHLRRLSSCLNLARNPLRVHRNAWENNATEGTGRGIELILRLGNAEEQADPDGRCQSVDGCEDLGHAYLHSKLVSCPA